MTIEIYDPIYDSIKLYEDEKELLDSEKVQRLRNIQQLGFSDLVYPNSTHTRFQHSLGVMHLATIIGRNIDLDEEIINTLRVAGLLHDTGHGPFSHVSEEVMEENGVEHEDVSCKNVEKLEDKINVDKELVKEMIKGKDEFKIIANEIDVDRMDYLKRDSHMSGLAHGEIDIKTVLNNSTMTEKGLSFKKKTIQAVENILVSRLLMTTSLYKHHTSRIAEKMMKRVLQRYVEEESVEKMKTKNDYQMIAELSNKKDPYIKEILNNILSRDIYKRCIYLNKYDIDIEKLNVISELDEKEVEKELSEELKMSDHQIIVDLPSFPSDIEPSKINIEDNGNLNTIDKYTSVCEFINKEQTRNSILGVYTSKDNVDEVREKAVNYFEIN